jgi:tetratricopeptide (TPR) repeat protein
MAEVTLHKYCEEAKELVRTDSYDQAIAICRYMLEQFPKYLASYRLLGEACLEKGEYVDAANLFKRVLGSDLEDFIAYVGLGIIYDEEGALEEAIWQLERAFELAPGNAEIRGELQRLYAQRDETGPARLKLTAAALGRLYLKEELYERAIDEFKAVLEDDPKRPDIQVALAVALWKANRKREAADVCEDILEQFPNCLKANLILGEILVNSDRKEEGWELLRTAQALDPENAVAEELLGDQSPLAPEPVYVRRLEQAEVEARATEIGPAGPAPAVTPVKEEEPAAAVEEVDLDESMPEWLRKLREEEKQSAAEEVVEAGGPEEMPEWLRQVREGAPEEAEEGRPAVGEGGPGPEAGELPSWLREVEEEAEPSALEEAAAPAPTGVEPAVQGEEEPAAEVVGEGAERVPDWLREARSDEEVVPAIEPEEEMPDWLRALKEEAAGPARPEQETIPEPEGAPPWLRQLREEAGEEVTGPAEEMVGAVEEIEEKQPLGEQEAHLAGALEELRAIEEGELDISEETMARLRETMPDESAPVDEIMAWLEKSSALIDGERISERPSEVPEEVVEEAPSLAGGEVPAWAQELRAEALAEEPEPAPEEQAEVRAEGLAAAAEEEEVPPWLEELRVKAREEKAEPAPFEEEVEAEEEAGLVLAEQAAVPSEEEEIPEWLRDLRAESEEEEAEPVAPEAPVEEFAAPSEAEEELPDWLRELREEVAREEAEPTPEEVEAPAEEPPPGEGERAEVPEPVVLEEGVPSVGTEEERAVEITAEEALVEVSPAVEKVREEAARGADFYLERLRADSEDHEARLGLARFYLRRGQWDQALPQYERFVSSGTLLAEVIDDLEAAADDAPEHLLTHELLADAYMKGGRLQDALDKYRWLRGKLTS